ncbi:SDR family NAD(P)-dependent oxidoreductase [Actinomadura rupiterrae]|uniref:SDR family NAD(P)-dependent oxidoreductase n=1 Tax=Actinomadura rupiterrae TaxID=559627 RepID=UPI0020A30259|nr:SDR family NAD(P)-dependent oxidoreductase [Actinomadura rupiterrae]MCP2339493.1 NAD(P)-dependent dehydrogenase (short-subunit alcohol dehydrogenase family) [Actinomadura rupiterrae]
MTETSKSAAGRVVVVTGANGAAGRAVVERLAADGATVVAAGRSVRQWDSPRIVPAAADLLDADTTRAFADGVLAEHGRVDGLIHLVGGWRGAPSFPGTDLADWAFLHDQVVRTLQHTTLAFHDALSAAPSGRFAMVSQPAAQHPDAGSAAYGAAKAAAETWTLAMAASFAKTAQADGTANTEAAPKTSAAKVAGTGGAATILVVNALVTEPKPGLTHVDDLAATVAGLWDRPASDLNGNRIELF